MTDDPMILREYDPTDAELIEAVAIECMGWTIYGGNPSMKFYSDEPNKEYLKANVIFTARPTKFFDDPPIKKIEVWNPITNFNHTFLVLRRLIELGFAWDIEHTKVFDDLRVQIYPDREFNSGEWPAPITEHYKNIDGLGRAICLAAKKAAEEKKCTQTDITK